MIVQDDRSSLIIQDRSKKSGVNGFFPYFHPRFICNAQAGAANRGLTH